MPSLACIHKQQPLVQFLVSSNASEPCSQTSALVEHDPHDSVTCRADLIEEIGRCFEEQYSRTSTHRPGGPMSAAACRVPANL